MAAGARCKPNKHGLSDANLYTNATENQSDEEQLHLNSSEENLDEEVGLRLNFVWINDRHIANLVKDRRIHLVKGKLDEEVGLRLSCVRISGRLIANHAKGIAEQGLIVNVV